MFIPKQNQQALKQRSIKQVVKLRKMDRQKRQEQEEILELYKCAIGLE
ncbi:GapR family DNA-binding domain-containing protein [Dyadobacter frigoris]